MGFFGWEYLKKASWKMEARGIALWISLNLADLLVTMDGRFIGVNPIAAWLEGNIVGLVVYKLALTLFAIVLVSYLRKLHLLIWLNVVMAIVVVWKLAWLGIS